MSMMLSETTIRQIVQTAAESLGQQATVESVKAVVTATLEKLQQDAELKLPPKDTEHRQKYNTELLSDWLRAVVNKEPIKSQQSTAVPQREPQASGFIITVLGKDRPGVVAEITKILASGFSLKSRGTVFCPPALSRARSKGWRA